MLLANNLISFETLIPFAVFGGIAAVAWWVMDMVASGMYIVVVSAGDARQEKVVAVVR